MASRVIVVLIGTWFLFMVLAIINAGIRNAVFKPIFGELAAHQISTLLFIVIVLSVTYIVFIYSNIEVSDTEAIYMGAMWLIFTILFEFIAGHYAFGNSWEKLFADYNILNGRVWGFVLLAVLISPYIANKLQ
jgi:hypothetical protein